jgi:integrase
VNIKGEFQGMNWLGFDRQRPGRRREFILKYRSADEWRSLTAPVSVTSEVKFRKWAIGQLEQLAELGVEPKRAPRDAATTVAALFEKWVLLREANKEIAGVTVYGDRSKFRVHILPRWGTVQVASLESRAMRLELRAWVRELGTKLTSVVAVRGVVSTFSQFVLDATLEGWVNLRSNPLRSVEVTDALPTETERRRVVVLPVEVGQALIDAKPIALIRRVRYAVALNTGANDGEIAGARVSSLLTLRGPFPRLEISQAFKLRGGKVGPEGGPRRSVLGKTKNRYRVRAIPLNECARAALIEWLEHGWELWVGRQPEPSDPLFPNTRGGFSRPSPQVRQDLELAGQPTHDETGKPYEFRTLRRTFSTLLRSKKVDRELRERLMGQSSVSVNSEHYTAEVPEEHFDAVRRIPLRWRVGGALVAELGGPSANAADYSSSGTLGVSFGQASAVAADSAYGGNGGVSEAPGSVQAGLLGAEDASATKKDGDELALEQAVAEHRLLVELPGRVAENRAEWPPISSPGGKA